VTRMDGESFLGYEKCYKTSLYIRCLFLCYLGSIADRGEQSCQVHPQSASSTTI
jgi:hypothetical protein